jgi:hypothetical protein
MRVELALMLEDINTKFGEAQKQEFEDESIDDVNSLEFKYRLPNHFVAIAQLCALHFTNIVILEMNHGISEGSNKIASVVKDAVSWEMKDIKVMFKTKRMEETLYYITGWLIHSISKGACGRKKDTRDVLKMISTNAKMSDKNKALLENLPTKKVEHVENFGGLKYANRKFFDLVTRIEYVFVNILTAESLLMIGSGLILKTYKELIECYELQSMIKSFLQREVDTDQIFFATEFIVKTYCRMRGKDFARKMMSCSSKSTKMPRRQKLATTVDSNGDRSQKNRKRKRKNKSNIEEVQQSENANDSSSTTCALPPLPPLLPQQQDDLFSEEDEYTLFLHAANYFGDPDDEYELSREEEELFDSGYEDLVDNQLPVAV